MASQEERARRRVCTSFEDAEMVLAELGQGNKVYLVSLPNREVYVVAQSGNWAVGLAAVVEGLLPPARHITASEEVELLREIREARRKAMELESRLRQQREKR